MTSDYIPKWFEKLDADSPIVWRQYGDHDFLIAKQQYELGKYEVSAFFLQQSLEKYLKALCFKKRDEVEEKILRGNIRHGRGSTDWETFDSSVRTHGLVRLSNLCDFKLEEKVMKYLGELGAIYMAARYPDLEPEDLDDRSSEGFNKSRAESYFEEYYKCKAELDKLL
jgi:HEPN domain-containing protein